MQQIYSCPNCNYPVAFGSKFCINCGTPLTWQQQEYRPRKQDTATAGLTPAMIALIVLLFGALLVTGGIFAFGELSPLPVISEVYASPVTDSTAVITWVTDRLSSSQVEYGISIDYGSISTLINLW